MVLLREDRGERVFLLLETGQSEVAVGTIGDRDYGEGNYTASNDDEGIPPAPEAKYDDGKAEGENSKDHIPAHFKVAGDVRFVAVDNEEVKHCLLQEPV